MIVIADSGSTKADWKMVDNNGTELQVSTIGFNPYFYSSDAIESELRKSFVQQMPVEKAKEVFFYGAGCSDPIRCAIIAEALVRIFPNAQVTVDHDLLAAARATCGPLPGVACILGTGSNSCEYDGIKITDNVTNLAYLVGDEGSGSHLGKKLVRAYFYRELPEDLVAKFDKNYPGGKRAILDRIYEDTPSNVYLAAFAKFLSDHKEHFFIKKLVYESFSEFVDRHVRKYKLHAMHPVHFIGSVAFHFQDILQLVLKERGLQMGIVVKKPIDNLVKFHLKKSITKTSVTRH